MVAPELPELFWLPPADDADELPSDEPPPFADEPEPPPGPVELEPPEPEPPEPPEPLDEPLSVLPDEALPALAPVLLFDELAVVAPVGPPPEPSAVFTFAALVSLPPVLPPLALPDSLPPVFTRPLELSPLLTSPPTAVPECGSETEDTTLTAGVPDVAR